MAEGGEVSQRALTGALAVLTGTFTCRRQDSTLLGPGTGGQVGHSQAGTREGRGWCSAAAPKEREDPAGLQNTSRPPEGPAWERSHFRVSRDTLSLKYILKSSRLCRSLSGSC